MKETLGRASVETAEGASGRRLLKLAEAADFLQVTVSALYKMTCRTARFRIPHIRLGGRIRFRQDDLDRWVVMHRVSDMETLEKIHTAAGKTARAKANGISAQTPAA